ncbi:MAG: hypothetical protein DRJ10_10555, partial [Bacteroidetes bacterium]
SDAPYEEKPHLHLTKESFNAESLGYFLEKSLTEETLLYKKNNLLYALTEHTSYYIFKTDSFELHPDKINLQAIKNKIKEKSNFKIPLQIAAEMSVILKGVQSFYGQSLSKSLREKNNGK